MKVLFDISQLVLDPRRTGIQRVERELLRHWPGNVPLVPCRFSAATNRLHALPDQVTRMLLASTPGDGGFDHGLESLLRDGPALDPQEGRLLCAELFADPARAAFYEHGLSQGAAGGRAGVHALVYDFLPWLHPERFGRGGPLSLMPYLRMLRAIPNLAFISQATRDEWLQRISRGQEPDGPVLPLGGDSLGLARQHWHPGRRDFLWLGTLEPRKGPEPLFRAVLALLDQGHDLTLTVIGTADPEAHDLLALVQRMRARPQIRVLGHAGDDEIRAAFTNARALVFPSTAEGYGLPPMEALHAGVPVVVSAGLPALAGLPDAGQIRLDTVDQPAIEAALCRLLEDDQAATLWQQASTLHIPGWADFARGVADWMQA